MAYTGVPQHLGVLPVWGIVVAGCVADLPSASPGDLFKYRCAIRVVYRGELRICRRFRVMKSSRIIKKFYHGHCLATAEGKSAFIAITTYGAEIKRMMRGSTASVVASEWHPAATAQRAWSSSLAAPILAIWRFNVSLTVL
jgi:hypothetical protein